MAIDLTNRVDGDQGVDGQDGHGDQPNPAGSRVWGQGLGYPEWIEGSMPAVHDGVQRR